MKKNNEFYGCPVKNNDNNEPSLLADVLAVFELLKPSSSDTSLMRIGGTKDGAYLLPDDLDGVTACFSPGVNNFKTFEDFLVDEYDINCHMCDYSSDETKLRTPIKQGKQTFQKKWLDIAANDDSITLDDWVNQNAPDGDLILQIDIEGAEYRNLLSVSEETLKRFRIIVIELHGLEMLLNAAVLQDVLAPFFERISDHFSVVHAHPNNFGGDFAVPGTSIRIPRLLELTYLRNDRVVEGQSTPCIPHPLDIDRNVPDKPPLFLGTEWIDGERTPESKMKVLEEKVAYADYKINDLEGRIASLREANKNLLRGAARLTKKYAKRRLPNLRRVLGKRTEVAEGKPFALSSAYGLGATSGVVKMTGDFFFHTNFGANEYIRIDLGSPHAVTEVVVENRRDACFSRAAETFVILTNDPEISYEWVFKIRTNKKFLSGQKATASLKIPTVNARFVYLISPLDTALHFADVKVFANV